jgi:hypothetical protein
MVEQLDKESLLLTLTSQNRDTDSMTAYLLERRVEVLLINLS